MEVFIPNTNEKYSISDEGVVYSNYKYDSWGRKVYRKHTLTPYLPKAGNRTASVCMIIGKKNTTNKGQYIAVKKLMAQCFNFKPPDEYHQYDLLCKNGDAFNLSIENLEYRIRTQSESCFGFYPQPYYNSKGEITHKVCGRCGHKKTIDCFKAQKHSGSTKTTFVNVCVRCISVGTWSYIKSDPERLRKSYEASARAANSENGRARINKYMKLYSKSEKSIAYRKTWLSRQDELITIHRIAAYLKLYKWGLTIKDISPELVELTRKTLFLNRTIKQIKHEKFSN